MTLILYSDNNPATTTLSAYPFAQLTQSYWKSSRTETQATSFNGRGVLYVNVVVSLWY